MKCFSIRLTLTTRFRQNAAIVLKKQRDFFIFYVTPYSTCYVYNTIHSYVSFPHLELKFHFSSFQYNAKLFFCRLHCIHLEKFSTDR